jgi:glycosyltransferase involved in cell wall biosynthesis
MVIVSSVLHFQQAGRLYAHGPYAREIDIWADLFPQIEIAAPCQMSPPTSDCVAFTRHNIRMIAQPRTGGKTLSAKIWQILLLPILIVRLGAALKRADAIQVRCPGNLGLLGALMAPLFCRYRVAKYAGQWNGFSGERTMLRLQRWILRSRWWAAPVTVYGRWPNQLPHVHPMFTCVMTAEQVQRANKLAAFKEISSPLRILFCGRLAREKRVGAVLESAAQLDERGVECQLAIVGEGPERAALEKLAADLGLGDRVNFVGAVPFEQVFPWYAWAHCLVLPSACEGWGKVIVEAMCFGVVCIGSPQGLLPEMLAGRGILLEEVNAQEIADAVASVAESPADMVPLRSRALEWSRQYSLEGLREALREVLSREWNTQLGRVKTESMRNIVVPECPPAR